MRLARLGIGLGLALSLCAPGSTPALDLGEWVPGLKLSPFLSERMEYETNVFQVPSNSQADAVFKTIPGFLAEYTFGQHTLSLGYRAEILNWVTLTSQDTVHHIGVTQLLLQYPRLYVNFRNDFVRTSDPPNTELTGQILSDTNVLAPEVEYKLTSRFSLGANYAWTHVSFDDQDVAQDLDRNEQLFGASVFWKALPRTDFRLNYNYGFKDFKFESDRNVHRHLVLFQIRGDVTEKVSSTFRIGFEIRDPDASFQPGYTGLVMGGDWVYRITDRTTFTLVTDRSVQESTFGDVPFYVTTSGAFGLQHQFWNKFTANVRAVIGQNEYPTKQTIDGQTDWRSDFFYSYGAGLEYAIRPWLIVGGEYAHIARRSNFNFFDFSDDKFTAKVTLQF